MRKNILRFAAVLMIFMLVMSSAACGEKEEEKTASPVRVSVLAGPTGIGAVDLWDAAEKGETLQPYEFTLVSENEQIIAAVSNGETDMAAVATNMASVLWNRTSGGVTVICVNTAGVLYMYSSGEEINDIASLAGHDIYLPGQGANPEYILRYVLSGNGLDPDSDVTLHFVTEGSELLNVWSTDPEAVIMAPQPVASSLQMNVPSAVCLFDMTEQWKALGGDSALLMGCVIVRTAYLEEHGDEVDTFLQEYADSIGTALADAAATGELCEKYGIIPKAKLAEKALPFCGLTFVTGQEMKDKLSGYLQVMYSFSPKSVGGDLPDDGFYYVQE